MKRIIIYILLFVLSVFNSSKVFAGIEIDAYIPFGVSLTYINSTVKNKDYVRFACSEVAGRWLFKNKEYEVIKNGIDVSRFKFNKEKRNLIRKSLNVKDNELLIGHVGRFGIQKNHRFLIEVFNKYQKNNYNVKLLLIGTGELKDQVKSQIDELGLSERVIILENKLNIEDYYNSMDIFLLPSLFENIAPTFYEFFNKYGTVMPPLLGTLALCIIQIDHEPIIKIDEAFKNGVPWGSLIMCAATLALGAALQNGDIGLITYLENTLGLALKSLPAIVLLIIFAIWAAIQTNLSSNMVTATLVATVASTILITSSSTLNLSATICIIGMLASFAFATPPSMPHIAIISSSPSCSTKDVLLYGLILMVISIIISLIVAYPLGTLIF